MASIWGELKRRNVVKVAVAYAIVGWLLVQIADVFFPALQLPEWTVTFVAGLVILGFPLALILSWAYELTPEGMKRSHEIPATEGITHDTGRKIDFVIIGVLAVAVIVFAFDRFVPVEENLSNIGDRRSVAALPFSNESVAAENAEFFANGIHDELLARLAKIGSLKVISRTSVEEYRDSPKNMREIGQELGVATILQGRVQRSGDMVRITVQLIDAGTDEHLWAEIYNRELTAENLFAIQSEMATAITVALQATLLPEEAARLSDVPTQNLRAYNFYLAGNDYMRRPDNQTAFSLAAQQYQRAVEEDPDFALAWAGLSRGHSGMYFFGVDPSESRREMAREAVERAFELAPDLPEAHLAMGSYFYHGFRNYERALSEYSIAERTMSGDALIHLSKAFVLRRSGEIERSVASMERAIELDPRNVEQLGNQAVSYLLLRDYAEAERHINQALEIQPDAVESNYLKAELPLRRDADVASAKAAVDNSLADLGDWGQWLRWTAAIYEREYETALAYLDDWDADVVATQEFYAPKASSYGVAYQLAGQPQLAEQQFQMARAQVEDALENNPEDPRLLTAHGEVLAGLGERGAAGRAANQAIELLVTSPDAQWGPGIRLNAIIRVLVSAGEFNAAIEELDAYLASPGDWSIEGLLPDPRLDPIREDPHFQALVEKYRRR